jgi:D-alanyl-D-alanine carboxypeptidase
MFRVGSKASRAARGAVYSLGVVLAALTIAPAAARGAPNNFDNPRYAAIVVDTNTGATLRHANANALRHPASLTKIMTLYLLFEQLEANKLKLTAQLPVSVEAASQAPTKLGLRAGQTISVEDAIKALITRSANDASVVIAEALAGSEDAFAGAMTRKAQTLGMTRTVYRNASGLPDDEQVTTARDQARLGIAIQERFPRYYRYFSTVQFSYRGATMRNHNRLLGKVAGVDGIKTGYTRASGYNLVSSVRRGGRHIIAVVLGGNSGAQRDAHMRDLIDHHIVEASASRPVVVAAKPRETAAPRIETRAAPRPEPKSKPEPRIVIVTVVPSPSETAAAIIPSTTGSDNPLHPTAVKTVPIKASTSPLFFPQIAAFAPAPELAPAPAEARAFAPPEIKTAELEAPTATVTGNISERAAAPVSASEPVAAPVSRPIRSAVAQNNWVIQIGAFEHEGEAKQRLSAARNKAAELLGAADPYTERTTKGEKTFFRARFAGFDRTQAEAACKQLQRNDIACMALKI